MAPDVIGSTTLGGCSVARTMDGRYVWASWSHVTGKHKGEAESERAAWDRAFAAASPRDLARRTTMSDAEQSRRLVEVPGYPNPFKGAPSPDAGHYVCSQCGCADNAYELANDVAQALFDMEAWDWPAGMFGAVRDTIERMLEAHDG